MSAPASTDRNLLFGLLALQMDLVTQRQLIEAMNAWLLEKQTPLGEILARRGVMDDDDRAAVEKLLGKHVKRHGGDPQASLAAVRVGPGMRASLAALDADVGPRLAPPTDPPASEDAWKTTDSADPDRHGASPGPPSGPSRYRRLREHAKGGLGEVCVARDEELGREVALKQIQERFADDLASRARFVREAEITGHLEHPGVVPVYGLGIHPDGRPYYAMRFIQGESMHDSIARFHAAEQGGRDATERSLALRELLGRFVAVCDAVAFAHSRGVIHRDLKPANVMLGEYGETLVVDWGLAKLLEPDDPEATTARVPVALSASGSAAVTELGQAVGTPAFMPPEQARGEHDKTGVASDVFSLAAILYDLLTGKPPHAGASGAEALALAREGNVIPARKRKPEVPRALEAVCAKALAASPEDRYSDARSLAAEVRRWLADEPVEAYREPIQDRARRWGRRHRSVVSAGVMLLLAGVVGLSVGLWAVKREQEKTKTALRLEEVARGEAEENLARALKAEGEAKGNLKQAEDNLKLAKKAIDECFNVARDHPLFQEPRMEKARKLLLEKTLPFYENFRDDPALKREEAAQWFRVGFIESVLFRPKQSEKAYRRSLALFEDQKEVPEYKGDVAGVLNMLGLLLRKVGREDEALLRFRRACELQSELIASPHKDYAHESALVRMRNNLGNLLSSQGKTDKSTRQYVEALELIEKWPKSVAERQEFRGDQADTRGNLGLSLHQSGQNEEALRQLEMACTLRTALVKDTGSWHHRHALGLSHQNVGIVLEALGEGEKAFARYDRAFAILDDVVRANPDVPEYRNSLASLHHNRGLYLSDVRKPKEALQEYAKARDLRQTLIDDHHDAVEYHKEMVETLMVIGSLSSKLGHNEEAVEHMRRALPLQRKLAETHRGSPDYQNKLAIIHSLIAAHLSRSGDRAKAMKEYELAGEIQAELVKNHDKVPEYQENLARTHQVLGEHLAEVGQPKKAVERYQQARDLQTRLTKDHRKTLRYKSQLADTLTNLGVSLAQSGETDKALEVMREGCEVGRALAGTGAPAHAERLATVCLNYGGLLGLKGQFEKSHAALTEGVEAADRLVPRDASHGPLLRSLLLQRANVAAHLQRREESDADWTRALGLTPQAERPRVRLRRAISRAQAGDYARSAAEAARLSQDDQLAGETLYNLSCVQAINALHAAKDQARPLPEREKRADGYARDAVALLKRAKDARFFDDQNNTEHLGKNADLDSLRQRDDFRAFVAGLKEK